MADDSLVRHRLQVELDPASGMLRVTDRIDLAHAGQFEFVLHAGLAPRSETPGVSMQQTGHLDSGVPMERWQVTLPATLTSLSLSYAGTIEHDFRTRTEAPGKRQALLAGTISSEGVFLDGSVAWYPRVPGRLQSFRLEASVPEGWTAISQGAGTGPGAGNTYTWEEMQPQTDIYLVAGKYQVYRQAVSDTIEAQVYLRSTDPALARRYLSATALYLKQYQALLGPYPYAKFALVENFWETGYGMPSFTLLGTTVIRLPFILHSSYPHEILHNWWGNGVYVDYDSGNWSEGLTTYLSDHRIQAQSGQGAAYRRDSLQRFSSFVREQNDFPLRDFRARHNQGSQAVGYGKGMMLFHMLRRKLGDELFFAGLRRFYRDNQFRKAGFEQLQQAFEQVSGQDLAAFFSQWLIRTGAPELALESVSIEPVNSAYRIRGRLQQAQAVPPFAIDVPLRVHFREQRPPASFTISFDQHSHEFSFEVPGEPARLEVDPDFDIFRIPDASELPSSLSGLFGSQSVLFVLPSGADATTLAAYRELAQQWASGYAEARISLDDELVSLADEPTVWLLGRENRFAEDFIQQLPAGQLERAADQWTLDQAQVDAGNVSLVLAHRDRTGRRSGWISAGEPEAIPGLARKLPHYGKYSYLAFTGSAPNNTLKGQWKVTDSSLAMDFDTP